jgi:hypothetical protein
VRRPEASQILDGTTWHKSSASGSSNCVEVKRSSRCVLVRDSKNRALQLEFTLAEWAAFLAGVRAGEFDCDSS